MAEWRHLPWIDRPAGPAQVLYFTSGAAEMESGPLNTMPGTWEMRDDGTRQVIGQSGDTLSATG
jgi:hypothetical protein